MEQPPATTNPTVSSLPFRSMTTLSQSGAAKGEQYVHLHELINQTFVEPEKLPYESLKAVLEEIVKELKTTTDYSKNVDIKLVSKMMMFENKKNHGK